jgi:elongation factor 1-alpha
MSDKPHINLVFVGHVDHGKSTLVGRLLLETGNVDPHLIDKYREEAAKGGKSSFEFAWVTDDLPEERARGITIRAQIIKFETQKYFFTIIDAPGHKDFIKNMITGTRQADAGVIVVDVPNGVQEQTKEHIFLARTLGVNQIIVAMNKMDATAPPYDEKRYKEIKDELSKLLSSVGYKIEAVPFVPLSAFRGENIIKPSDKMPWYRGPGLLEAIEMFKAPERPINLPFRWPIQDVKNIPGVGYIPVGKVETGTIKPNDEIVFMPANKKAVVKTIEMHRQQLQKAIPGDDIGTDLRIVGNWSIKQNLRRGDVAGLASSPPSVANTFTAQVIIFNHPGEIKVGYTPTFHCHTAQVTGMFIELLSKIDARTGQKIEDNPPSIRTGDSAIVKIRPMRPMVIEKAKEFPQLGRFAIRDMGMTIGAGLCMDVEKKIL